MEADSLAETDAPPSSADGGSRHWPSKSSASAGLHDTGRTGLADGGDGVEDTDG